MFAIFQPSWADVNRDFLFDLLKLLNGAMANGLTNCKVVADLETFELNIPEAFDVYDAKVNNMTIAAIDILAERMHRNDFCVIALFRTMESLPKPLHILTRLIRRAFNYVLVFLDLEEDINISQLGLPHLIRPTIHVRNESRFLSVRVTCQNKEQKLVNIWHPNFGFRYKSDPVQSCKHPLNSMHLIVSGAGFPPGNLFFIGT